MINENNVKKPMSDMSDTQVKIMKIKKKERLIQMMMMLNNLRFSCVWIQWFRWTYPNSVQKKIFVNFVLKGTLNEYNYANKIFLH